MLYFPCSRRRPLCLCGAVLVSGLLDLSAPAVASDETTATEPKVPWREVWAGVETLSNSWSVYSGTAFAWGDIRKPGWRLRTTSGYSRYRYRGTIINGTVAQEAWFRGTTGFSDVLAGYQFQYGDTTYKVFAGATFEGRTTNPLDRANDTLGTEYGGKVALEAWSWVTPATWVSVEASYATLFDTFKVGAQAGTNVFAKLAVGLEGQIDANETYGAGRAGVFAKTEFGPATLRAAGGFSADADFDAKLYGSLNVFFRY